MIDAREKNGNAVTHNTNELLYTICIYKCTLKISTYKNVHMYGDYKSLTHSSWLDK